MLAQRARDNLACVAFCGLVGGQDELVFDGHSVVIDHTGATIAARPPVPRGAAGLRRRPRRRPAQPACAIRACAPRRAGASGNVARLAVLAPRIRAGDARHPARLGGPIAELLAPVEAEVYGALCLGLRDYVEKNGFAHVVLGLSGGIDSALVACVAADALGPDRVAVTIMPSPYSSEETQHDARELADALGVERFELPIAEVMQGYERDLAEPFAGRAPDITEENLQARIRGNLLMALSNKFGWLVLATGNKSEMSVGYTTLYGDLAGGFAVIKDVPKTLVYRLCEWRNSPAGAAVPDGERGARRRADPRLDHLAGPLGGAAPRPARRGFAAPLRDPRPHPRGLCRARPQPRAADRPGPARKRRRPRDPARRPGRVQAPPGPSRDQDLDAGVRARPPHADHEPHTAAETRRRRFSPPRAALRRAWRAARRCSPCSRRAARSAGCGDTIQASRSPTTSSRSWSSRRSRSTGLGGSFKGLQITEASADPGGAFTVQYGNCLQGGQGTCTPPLRVVTYPDNSFLPGGEAPAAAAVIRGVPARSTEAGRVITIPTGGVVVGVFARDPALARAAAQQIVAINRPGAPGGMLPARLPDTGFGSTPLPSQRPRDGARPVGLRRGLSGDAGTGRTAIVMRVIAQRWSSSSRKRTSHTHVVRPR